MSRRPHISLDDVQAAKESYRPSAEDWVDGERGQRLLERVLAADCSARARRSTQRKPMSKRARLRLVFLAGAVALVAAVAGLTVLLVERGGDLSSQVVSTEGTQAAEQVTMVDAVESLVPVYYDLGMFDTAPTDEGSSLLEAAVALGLVSADEVSGGQGSRHLTQGDYAILIARVFAALLPGDRSVVFDIDPKATVDQHAAIETLMSAGVIMPEDGEFLVEQPLTKTVMDQLMTRTERAYDNLPVR